MFSISRRSFIAGLAACGASPSLAQTAARFDFEEVVKKARARAAAPYDASYPPLPELLHQLDFDAWRDIRFRPEKALLQRSGGRYGLQMFHLGHLFTRPVTINTMRDGTPAPVPYSASLFDYGRTKFEKPLPVNLGFAGFRVHYPLNNPKTPDELISFVGSSYFRFLGRNQQYGLSARGLSVNTGLLDNNEEFPFFREFWFDVSSPERITIFALLDSKSVAGAYRFDIYPGNETTVDVTATLFPRSEQRGFGFAPLTSMFFMGENDRHMNDRNKYDDFRPEMHDSDGLLFQTNNDEWVWRPLRNPFIQKVAYFEANDIRGFGLMQRDRSFNNYQDIELAYEARPSYWIEPVGKWGEGRLELIELATRDETADNIILAWRPNEPVMPDRPVTIQYRMTTMLEDPRNSIQGKVVNTFSAPAKALGSNEETVPGSRRFLVDFAGGDVSYYLNDPGAVELSVSLSTGKIKRSFLTPNPRANGLRASIDILIPPGGSTNLRACLKAEGRPISETWTYTMNDEGSG